MKQVYVPGTHAACEDFDDNLTVCRVLPLHFGRLEVASLLFKAVREIALGMFCGHCMEVEK